MIFVIAGALLYYGNDWMWAPLTVSLPSVPFFEIPPFYTKTGTVIATAFLLGMLFALIHSSLNWIDLIRKNRKLGRLESEMAESENRED